jgi:tRNA pseudouridine55 synthase
MDGYINFYKDRGIASNKALDQLKKILGLEKSGFLGTLDPVAVGVLPIAIGWGTRFLPYFEHAPKKYRATIIFGSETDTQDSTGKVTVDKPASEITRERFLEVMEQFKGEINQVPPMFSAKKIGGKRLYEIARKGGEVEREHKTVSVHTLELNDFSGGSAVFTAIVSRGTYIRTLCEDMGRKLGSAAHLGELAREGVHVFLADDGWNLDKLSSRKDHPEEWLLPLDYPLGLLPKITTSQSDEKSLLNGGFIFYSENFNGPIRLYSTDGRFIGIGKADALTKKIQPEKIIFHSH